MQSDTIAAISTGMTNAGIGKVRLSGDDAITIVDRIYQSPGGKKHLTDVPTHTIHYGYIYDGEQMIDEVLVLIMKGPNSYTKEDVVEIDCHGGVVVMKRLLETVIKYGARPAEPGEFTKRAFLNGRIDLSQAEAVIDIINAKSDMALESSLNQLRGSVREKIESLRKEIIGHIAFIEAALDDPEHIQADHFGEDLAVKVEQYISELEKLLASSDNGRMVKEGIKTVIVGKPNAGKSSLMNVLLGENRAIVTEIAGTTRDTLEESMTIHGIPLHIIDTAGIRQTEDIVEKIGVNKAIHFTEEADLIIYVVDSSTQLDQNDEDIMALIKNKKVIVLMNKSDLKTVTKKEDIEEMIQAPVVEISAKEETGLDMFENILKDMFFSGDIHFNDQVYITNIRHKTAIASALESLRMVMTSIENGMPEDFFSIDLMAAYEALGTIIGESVEEDLVNTIFSDFCMGK
jgi:tRNA modification GTPase